jgi:monoterpene epsilon-lactone hydrolase
VNAVIMARMSAPIRDQFRAMLVEQIKPAFHLDVPLAQQRQVLDGMGAAAPMPAGVTVERGELAGLPTERLAAADWSADHLLLHLHGGGYVMGSCASHRALTAQIAAACGIRAVLPEYRLAPEHPFPAALDDAVAVYRAAIEQVPAHNVVVVGDSAGGGLTLATLVALRDAGVPLPAAAVVLSPFTDMTFTGESVAGRADVDPWLSPPLLEPVTRHYVGEHDRRDPRLSPLFADLRGLPPLLIHVGDQEILLSDSTRLSERAREAGVAVELEVWPELWHVFHLFAPALPDAAAALAKIGAFVRGRLGLA